jgi:hypothetical protein
LEPLLQAWRQRTAAHKLSFQSRWQTISFGEAWREVVLVLVIPSAHSFAVVIFVVALALIVTVAMFFVAFSVSVTLGQREITAEQEESHHAGDHPYCKSHSSLPISGG